MYVIITTIRDLRHRCCVPNKWIFCSNRRNHHQSIYIKYGENYVLDYSQQCGFHRTIIEDCQDPSPSQEEIEAEQEQDTSAEDQVWDSVKTYIVRCDQCSNCRIIPSKEKYEKIRESIMEHPFTCEVAREWKPEIYCGDESDINQDGSHLRWAMDKPNIPLTPPGWQRLLRIRAQGGTKFADVYYVVPSKKRFRSMVQLDRYFAENPKYSEEGVTLSQFSFQSPAPLYENYVAKKRRARPASSRDNDMSLAGLQFGDQLENATIGVKALTENGEC